MRTAKIAGSLILAGSFLVTQVAELRAQTRPVFPSGERISVRLHGGTSLQADGELRAVADPGAALGLGFGYHFHPNFAIRVDGQAGFLGSNEIPSGPDARDFDGINLWHLTGGIEFNFWQNDPGLEPFTSTVNFGAGATLMDGKGGFSVDPIETLDEWYLTFNAGATAGYQLSSMVNLFASAQAYLIMADDFDTRVFQEANPGAPAFNSVWALPLTVGAKLSVF